VKVLFGGDYNPEQWPDDVWSRDYELFDAAGIDTVTLGVFDWALTQPARDMYDFATLDRVVDLETAVRVTPAGQRIRFLLNHRPSSVEVTLHCGGSDLLGGGKVAGGSTVDLPLYGVLVLAEG
jgi:hypothetical protein